MTDMHPFVEAWFRFNYLRGSTSLREINACWRNCPHDSPALRALWIHSIYARDARDRLAAARAIFFLTGESK